MGKVIPLALCLLAAVSGETVEEKETIRRTFRLAQPSAAKRVEVDNLNGSIRVAGTSGGDVELIAHQTISAESKEKVQQARQEVKLEIEQRDNTVSLLVDGPFRCKCGDGSINFRGWHHYGYKVRYDFELKVPQDAGLYLRTVNDGEIKVENVFGDYDIENINGGIEMLEAAGSGRAYALNGKLMVLFRKNPQSASYFGSLNGPVDLLFQPDLSADLRVKTFNGKIYSDFPVTYLPPAAPQQERRNGKFVFKADRFAGARVGKGGPEIKLDGFNGDIRIRQRGSD
ncbi:MAG: hypothetical protein HY236_12950 [Acidobacteria bacterium]|nr:hypothetical protein [Acidobacteriota bacterium]